MQSFALVVFCALLLVPSLVAGSFRSAADNEAYLLRGASTGRELMALPYEPWFPNASWPEEPTNIDGWIDYGVVRYPQIIRAYLFAFSVYSATTVTWRYFLMFAVSWVSLAAILPVTVPHSPKRATFPPDFSSGSALTLYSPCYWHPTLAFPLPIIPTFLASAKLKN
jgi:hypothetical protein